MLLPSRYMIAALHYKGAGTSMVNVNTEEYWDRRFDSGDWESKKGRSQTENFAIGQMRHIRLDPGFRGSILDFGCGLGDAIPIYKRHFPQATFVGIDISESAMRKCSERYGSIASFRRGSADDVPESDVIIASNVLEHLEDDVSVAQTLLSKCKELYIIVPYKEKPPLCSEHVNVYDEQSFADLSPVDFKVFLCRGWSVFGFDLWFRVYFKNIFRFLFGQPLLHRGEQIMFRFVNDALLLNGGGN
jgi:SAM-dependent methyltransferase